MSSCVAALDELLSRPEGRWTLAEGAVAVAGLGGRRVQASTVEAHLTEMTAVLRAEVGIAKHPRFAAAGLTRAFFENLAFRVIPSERDDEELRFIDCALDTRRATRSLATLLFIDLARRSGVRVEGSALPGRLVLRLSSSGHSVYLDSVTPFPLLSTDDLERRTRRATKGRVSFRAAGLATISPSQVLARLVQDLKSCCWRRAKLSHALDAGEMMLTIRPDDPREIRDRGRLLYLLGHHDEAVLQLERYLRVNPRGDDADAIRRILLEARSATHSQLS